MEIFTIEGGGCISDIWYEYHEELHILEDFLIHVLSGKKSMRLSGKYYNKNSLLIG